MKRTVLFIMLGMVVLVALIMVMKAMLFKSRQMDVDPVTDIHVDGHQAALNLSRAIQFKTISYRDPTQFDPDEFRAFHRFLEETYPGIHSRLTKKVINEYSLLYTWEGTDTSLKPVLFMAHMDVVPINPETEGDWTHPPFEGRIADGFIWGRGSLDDKVSLMAIMEAVETLITNGFRPRRSLYLAFGHDEEIGGEDGAVRIAASLKSRGVEAEYILDESGVITIGIVPGVSEPTALVGIAEKGYLTLELSVTQEGGHSSMPPPHSAIGILSTAIHNLERNQLPSRLEGPTARLFDWVGPEMPFGMKLVFANPWLLGWLIEFLLEQSNSTNASIRSTTAATIIEAGEQENVLPQRARAVLNFRLLQGDTIKDVIRHVEKTVDDPMVKVGIFGSPPSEASRVSDVDSEGFKILERTIRQVFPDTIVAPYLVVAGTDARHYSDVSESILRFLPIRLMGEDLRRIHGTNERVGVKNYEEIMKFYIQMVRNSN
ncbi:MAG: M20 family peptidase [Proteobacteria bacterium]|nr:M20 family peptidase [Pseudomonadota bacterium]